MAGGLISWQDVTQWQDSPINEAALTVTRRKDAFDQAADDLDSAVAASVGVGQTFDSMRNVLRRAAERGDLLSSLLARVRGDLLEMYSAVENIKQQIAHCRGFADSSGLVISGDGRVTYSAQLQVQIQTERDLAAAATGLGGAVRGVARGIVRAATGSSIGGGPIEQAAKANQASLEALIQQVLQRATRADHELTDALRAAHNDEALGSGSFGSASAGAPELPLDAADYWDPPKSEQQIEFSRALDADETFPPAGVVLSPNTAYEVKQQDGDETWTRGIYYTDESGAITHVDAHASRDSSDPLNADLREPAPNTAYRVVNANVENPDDGSTMYVTDKLSRTETIVMDNLDDSVKGDRHQSIQSGAGWEGSYPGGIKGDGAPRIYDYNGGHGVASQFGGIREEINLTPQLADVNQARRGQENYFHFESEWKDAIGRGEETDVVVRHVFDSDEQSEHHLIHTVPTTYMVDYALDGSPQGGTIVMNNTP